MTAAEVSVYIDAMRNAGYEMVLVLDSFGPGRDSVCTQFPDQPGDCANLPPVVPDTSAIAAELRRRGLIQ